MITIKIDFKNDGEAFWGAARTLDPRAWNEPYREAARALRALAGDARDGGSDRCDEVETSATEEQIRAVAETLPGWADPAAPSYARHPIVIEA